MPKELTLSKRLVAVSSPDYKRFRRVIIYANDEDVIRFLLTHQAKEIIEDAPDITFSSN